MILNAFDIDLKDFTGTTFKKEVLDKIGENEEISSLEFDLYSEDKKIIIKNKQDIQQIAEIISPLKLKEGQYAADKEIWINISVQDEVRFLLALSDDKSEIMIADFKAKKVNYYKIENDFDLEKIKETLFSSGYLGSAE